VRRAVIRSPHDLVKSSKLSHILEENIMKIIISCALAASLFATSAAAQDAQQNSQNPAVKDNAIVKVDVPAEGSNSFTEDQAKGRIAKAGYSHISRLVKDEQGVWRGAAMRKGKRVSIGLDYKGNITIRKSAR
jgi:opacity protein-like surface antigen